MEKWRLLLSGPNSSIQNMAIDAALLESGKPTFRVYEWSLSTLSLGYFQPYQPVESYQSEGEKIPVIRRMTGGGAIFHHQELTFSFVFPFSSKIPKKVDQSYQFFNKLLIASFAKTGYTLSPRGGVSKEDDFFCYNRHNPYDLMWNNKKLIGCAQRRGREVLLHHGSIPRTKNPLEPAWNFLQDPNFSDCWIQEICLLLEDIFKIKMQQEELSCEESEAVARFSKKFQAETYLKRH